MAIKTSIPKGTRDFTPQETTKREYIFQTIKNVYKKYGFVPIETPAMENLSTLMGKYGEEGDRLIFKILNSGDFMAKIPPAVPKEESSAKFASMICKKALRYDLTVPFARYVVQHRNELIFPFKRYQIQPVWRADNPQKGRYREFYQCDADVIGSDSLLNESELVQIIDEVFDNFNLAVEIKINNRKILSGIAEVIGEEDKLNDITVAIDKIEKIGLDKVIDELKAKGLTETSISELKPILLLGGSNDEKVFELKELLKGSITGTDGINEIIELLEYVKTLEIGTPVTFDLTLARGLDYYTGTIFEVVAKDSKMGSICGGGRYDDLTGIFGLKDVSGVGISFGAERIYDVLLEKSLFPGKIQANSTLLFTNFGEEEARYCLKLLKKLRNMGISAELYPDNAKMKKQMNYADKKNIPYVAIIGPDEMQSGVITVKNMKTGEQQTMSFDELQQYLNAN